MKTNKDKLVMHALSGRVHHPTLKSPGYWVGYDGYGRIPMGVGGITYNYKIGDSCMGIMGDHIEPGISLKNSNSNENDALMAFACVGNIAKVTSGDAKGALGFVTGKHGGIDHTMIYFPLETLEKMNIDDNILIKAYGQGLKIEGHEDVFVMNLDPELLMKMNIKEEGNALSIGVTHKIPAYLMGSGLGATTMMNGDYDIMTQDYDANKIYHLDTLKFGDIVCIEDHDNEHGAHYKKGKVSIGVIVHGDSFTSGHGPGVCVLFSADANKLFSFIDSTANLSTYLL